MAEQIGGKKDSAHLLFLVEDIYSWMWTKV